jgi:hypothetical protein
MVETKRNEGMLLREDFGYYTASMLHSSPEEEGLDWEIIPVTANCYSSSLALCNTLTVKMWKIILQFWLLFLPFL